MVKPYAVDVNSGVEARRARRTTTRCALRGAAKAASRGRMKARMPEPASLPDASAHFGRFGGRYVPETLMAPLVELDNAYGPR